MEADGVGAGGSVLGGADGGSAGAVDGPGSKEDVVLGAPDAGSVGAASWLQPASAAAARPIARTALARRRPDASRTWFLDMAKAYRVAEAEELR